MQKLMALIKALKYIKLFIEWVDAFILKKRGNAKVDKAQDASKAIDEANKIVDDKARLEAKAKAAKELEDAIRGK